MICHKEGTHFTGCDCHEQGHKDEIETFEKLVDWLMSLLTERDKEIKKLKKEIAKRKI